MIVNPMADAQATESRSDSLGEFVGTSILVLFGCGSVAVAVLFSSHSGLLQIAAIWGAAVTLAIYSTRHLALVFLIFSLSEGCNVGRPDDSLSPLFIGLSLCVIISVIAPLTQAGLNPARDLSPRLLAYLAGWKQAAVPDNHLGFLTVYIIGPIVGGVLAALTFKNVIEPIMHKKNDANGCGCA